MGFSGEKTRGSGEKTSREQSAALGVDALGRDKKSLFIGSAHGAQVGEQFADVAFMEKAFIRAKIQCRSRSRRGKPVPAWKRC